MQNKLPFIKAIRRSQKLQVGDFPNVTPICYTAHTQCLLSPVAGQRQRVILGYRTCTLKAAGRMTGLI